MTTMQSSLDDIDTDAQPLNVASSSVPATPSASSSSTILSPLTTNSTHPIIPTSSSTTDAQQPDSHTRPNPSPSVTPSLSSFSKPTQHPSINNNNSSGVNEQILNTSAQKPETTELPPVVDQPNIGDASVSRPSSSALLETSLSSEASTTALSTTSSSATSANTSATSSSPGSIGSVIAVTASPSSPRRHLGAGAAPPPPPPPRGSSIYGGVSDTSMPASGSSSSATATSSEMSHEPPSHNPHRPLLSSKGAGAAPGSPRNRAHQWQSTSSVHNWSVSQVTSWLTCLEMEQYVNEFIAKTVDGPTLLQLDSNKMKNLGVSSTDRTILKRKIKDLKATAEKEKKAAEKERKEAEKKAKREGGAAAVSATRRKFFN